MATVTSKLLQSLTVPGIDAEIEKTEAIYRETMKGLRALRRAKVAMADLQSQPNLFDGEQDEDEEAVAGKSVA